MGVSGISAADDDQETSKPEGSVEEAPVETTTKPQYQFTVATDENEIRETERTSESQRNVSSIEITQSQESTSTQSPSMSSTGKPAEASTASFTEQGSGDLTIDSIAEDERREHESSGEDISDVSTKQPESTTAPLLSSPATTKEEFTTLSVSGDATLETAVEVDATLSIGTTAEVPKFTSSAVQTPESEVTEKDASSTEKPSVAFISNVTLTGDKSSGDQTPDMFTKESVTTTVSSEYITVKAEQMTSTTKVSSLFSTEKPTTAQQDTATKDSEKTATISATSLFSSEKPSHITTSVSKEIATVESIMTAAANTFSSLHSTEETAHVETTILEEESSGDLTSDMFTTQSAATLLSLVYSTVRPEQPEVPSSSEMLSVVPIIDETETSTILPSEEYTSSGGATTEMFTKDSVATTSSTSESVSVFTTTRPTVTSSSILTLTEEDGSGDQTPDMFTKAPVSSIEFVSSYTTVHTSTGQVMEQTSESTQYTHSTSSPRDLEGSGISKTEDDQETTQVEGLGVEVIDETTTKPQDLFSVVTDETEIKETESKSEVPGVASSTQSTQLSQESTSSQNPLSTSTAETIESAPASLSEQGSGDLTEPTISESDATEGESSGDDTSAITTVPLHTTSSSTDSLVTKSVSTEVTNGTKGVEQTEEPTDTDGPSAGPVSSVTASVVTFTDEESSGYLTPEMFTKESTTPTSLGSEALMITSSSAIISIDQFQSTTVGTVITPTEEIYESPIESPTAAVETLAPSVDQAAGLASTSSPFFTTFTYVDMGVSGISAADDDQETSKPEGTVEEAPVETTTKPQYQFTVAIDENEIRETESTSESPSNVSSIEITQSQKSTSTQSPFMSSTGKPTEASTASFTEQGSGDLTIDSIAEDERREHESSGEDISDVSTKQPESMTVPLLSSPATTKEGFTTLSVSGDATLETAVEVDATLSIGTTAEVPKFISSAVQTPESEVTEKDASSTEKPSVALISNVTLTGDKSSGDQTPDMFTKESVTTTVSSEYSTVKAEQMTSTTKVSSLFSTEKLKQILTREPHETATAETASNATNTTSSLYSTEKPTTAQQDTATKDSEKTATISATSLFSTEKPKEDGSGDQTPDMFTKAPVSSIEFVSSYTTVHTSTGQVMEQTSESTQYTHSTSSPRDLEGSGISKTEDDQETTQVEGLGVEVIDETTTKPQDLFSVVTDETEIKETEKEDGSGDQTPDMFTKAPVSSIEFVSSYTTVHTSTGQVMEQTSESTQYTHSTSSPRDLEGSGISKTEDDQETTQVEGLGVEVIDETTTKPQDLFSVVTDETEIKETESKSEALGVASSTQSTQLSQESTSSQNPLSTSTAETIESAPASLSEQGSGDLTEPTISESDATEDMGVSGISAADDDQETSKPEGTVEEAPVETTTKPQYQFTVATNENEIRETESTSESPKEDGSGDQTPDMFTKAPVSSIEFVSSYTTVHTSTGQVMEQTSESTQYTHSTSSPRDLEGSGISKTEDDQETTQVEGLGVEVIDETTTKPQDLFSVVTDETEIKETESKSEALGVASSTQSTQLSQESTSSQNPLSTSTAETIESAPASLSEQGSGDLTEPTISESDATEGESSGDDTSAITTVPLHTASSSTDSLVTKSVSTEVTNGTKGVEQTEEPTDTDGPSAGPVSSVTASVVTFTDEESSGYLTPEMFTKESTTPTSLGSEALMIAEKDVIISIDQFQSTTVGKVITPTEEIDESPKESPTAAVETLEPSVDQAAGLASTSSPFFTPFTYVDMGVSGISAADDDQETSKPEGTVEEAPVETTTKPQYQFTVATDENEIRETESTSESSSNVSSIEITQSHESTSTQSPSMSSTGKPTEASTASFTEQGSGDLTIDSIAEDELREHESSGEDISDVFKDDGSGDQTPDMFTKIRHGNQWRHQLQ
ncbi:mucin-22-like [Oncorhynchus clarkii lewisi]|uniref:mucin-22-like n=1 Tax=Oncorhynchus clarkii lewisi TaxID=490388 RepID=UPI0039B99CFA